MVLLRPRTWLLAALLALAPPGYAQDETELKIKAAYLYKFGDFVEWPDSAFAGGGEFVIGVLGADAFARELERLVAGRSIQGRPVAVRRLRAGEAPAGMHMVFVGGAEDARLYHLAEALRGQPALLVTEADNAITRGSMINFVVAENKVRFDVALPAAERGHLKISARLLTVARRVLAKPS